MWWEGLAKCGLCEFSGNGNQYPTARFASNMGNTNNDISSNQNSSKNSAASIKSDAKKIVSAYEQY